MKIIAVGRNYAAHATEFKNEIPDAPIIFLKPDTALLRDNKPFYLPAFSNEIQHEIELVLKISKEGKHISEKFADRYYDEIGLGIDFTARDIQQNCKEKGLPWELAKAFDNSSPVGGFVPKHTLPDLQNIHFYLTLNEKIVQTGATQNLLFTFNTIISFVSRYITLKKGDLIFTGTPEGAGPVAIGDKLQGYLEGIKLLDFEIK